MPSPTQSCDVSVYRQASEVPEFVMETLHHRPISGNIILPHLAESRVAGTHSDGQVWIVCVTTYTGTSSKSSVDFILSCTDGKLGPLPVFIFTALPCDTPRLYTRKRLADMADKLIGVIPQDRVFSVFAPDIVADEFAGEWTSKTGIAHHSDLVYYHAWLMCCTEETLQPSKRLPLPGCVLRLATQDDAPCAAELCYCFALDSPPFVLTPEQAQKEANLLIRKGQLWVYEAADNGKPVIMSILAVTRTSELVAGITKVYTHVGHRKKGCAELLVSHVTSYLLSLEGKKDIVLYAGRENPARHVYSRVGFKTFKSGPHPDTTGEDGSWKELGFDTKKVRLGHW